MATCNGAATLPKVLSAYCALQVPDGGWSLWVVNDGSTDATAAVLAQFATRLPLRVLHQARRGKNAALNAAVEQILQSPATDLLVLSDDDAAPDPDWLVQFARCARAQPAYALFGGTILPDWAVEPPPWVLKLVPLGLTFGITDVADGPVFPGLVWGANMAVRRAVFDAGHRFQAAIGPARGAYAMGGETEFNRRIGAAGHQAWFCTAARVRHHIRAHQLSRKYLLQRALRNGRGAQAQGIADPSPRWLGVPRWMFAKWAREALASWWAACRRDRDSAFAHAWEACFLRGVITQAWTRRTPPVRTRVLITSCSGQLGGMEMRMAQEARLLHAAGYGCVVATPPFDGIERMAQGLRAERIAMHIFDPPQFFEQWRWRRLNLLRARWQGARAMRRFHADLVHIALCWNDYGASALWLASHCGLPSVLSVHSTFALAAPSRWHQPLYRQAFERVRAIYAVSQSALERFVQIYGRFMAPATRLHVIPNGVDTQRFIPCAARRASSRLRLGIPAQALVMGSVARLSAEKRPEALMALFCALRARFPELYLVLVGQGPLEQPLRGQARAAGVEQFVVFAGYCADVEQLLPAFDLHLLLSRSEGFGIATVEAMACAVPVVGTEVAGIADILRDRAGGILVPLDDAALTEGQVGALLADPGRRERMGRQARIEAEAAYSAETMRQRLLDLYASVLP